MKDAARRALDAASVRGVTYADARVVSLRNRSLTTKNGRVGHASESESLGIGVRVIAGGAWGFAASADLGRAAVEAAGAARGGNGESLGAGETGRRSTGSRTRGSGGVDDTIQGRSVHHVGGAESRS